MDTAALGLTLRLAAATTVILLGIALPLAWWIARGHSAARTLTQAIVALPLVLPPTVIGFYLLVGLGPLTATGRILTRLLGHPLAFSFSGLLIGSILYSLPFAVQPLIAGFRAIDPASLDAAAGLGRSPRFTFWHLVLPLTRPSLLTAAVLTFTHTLGEFGVVLMIGGNIPGITRTLSIALYDQVADGNFIAAAHLSLLLLAFSLAALLLVHARPRWKRSPHFRRGSDAV